MTLHLGFTGTRHGMSPKQLSFVEWFVITQTPMAVFHAHHGDCSGADEQFHAACRNTGGRAFVEVHAPIQRGLRAFCQGDQSHEPEPFMARNAAIVSASQILIAAPLQDVPQLRGGSWSTIRMARRALLGGTLKELYVVGRDGQLLDHKR